MSKQFIGRLFIAGSILTWAACQDQKTAPAAPPPVSVSIYTVATDKATYYDAYPATVVALNQIDLRPQVNGYITGIFFTDGSRVKKGQKLYEVDRQQYQANVLQAQANLQVQQTNMMKAQKDADRYHELEKNDAIAKQTVDYADAALEAAKKQVEAARANVQGIQTGLKYTTIYAPFDGTIGISQVKLGTSVSAGQTLLNTVSSDDPMAVDVAVDQKDLVRFTSYQQKAASGSDSTFRLELPGGVVYNFPGRITLVDRAVDPQTGTIKVRLVFPNKQSILKPGMSCNIRILNNSNTEKTLIPNKAVTEQMGEYFVYVLTDSNTVHQKKVLLGMAIGDKIIVNDGLNTGEKIVTEGVQKLREGAHVQVGAPQQPGTATAPAKPN